MHSRAVGGLILILLGGLLLADNLFPSFSLTQVVRTWWPLALIVLGVSLLFRK